MRIPTDHPFDFDSTHGLGLDELRATRAPQGAPRFDEFWRGRHVRVLGVNPQPRLGETGSSHSNWRVHDIVYTSTDVLQIVTETVTSP